MIKVKIIQREIEVPEGELVLITKNRGPMIVGLFKSVDVVQRQRCLPGTFSRSYHDAKVMVVEYPLEIQEGEFFPSMTIRQRVLATDLGRIRTFDVGEEQVKKSLASYGEKFQPVIYILPFYHLLREKLKTL